MKKKFFGLMVLTLSALFLVACSSSSSSSVGESLEGKYYGFFYAGSDVVLTENPGIVIEGNVLKKGYPDESKVIYKVDRKNKLFEGDSETLSYTLKDGVLTLNGSNTNDDTYVKAGSDKYKELKEKSSE
ncbi:hypothetical protein [Streptococcus ferus]|uniref:hypothetical protein n=1 Tax=Streptococcus ferus TaxID=1345 RepID=UPI002353A625|nr:hypothetical protein [Streptococcus ferus]